MHVKDIKATVPRVTGIAVKVGGFVGRHKRVSIAVAVGLLLFAPLLTGDGELVFLNAVGLGLGAPLLRRFIRPRGKRRTGWAQHNTKEDTMTTPATTIGGIGTRPRLSLEELVDRLMAALFQS